MLEVLPALASLFWNICTQIFNLYMASSVLCGFFVLWLIDRMFGIFDVIKNR